MIKLPTIRKLGKIIGFNNSSEKHIKKKILRDSLDSKGDNKLNPYKNRCRRWKYPIVILSNQKPPTRWKCTKIIIAGRGHNIFFKTNNAGWGFYVRHKTWQSKLNIIRKKRHNVNVKVGRFKIGIPYEESAKEKDCILIALTLAYQAHRILGRSEQYIAKHFNYLSKAAKRFPLIRNPKCPFCKTILTSNNFIEISNDTTDVFYKRKEANDDTIQLFHINCLKPGQFLHKPGNVAWGHRRCNVAIGKHDVSDAECWLISVMRKRGWKIRK